MKPFLIFVLGFFLQGENTKLQVVEDFGSHLKILDNGKFVDFEGQRTNVVYLSLPLEKGSGYLQLQSNEIFFLFINASLVAQGNYFKLSADSLLKSYQRNIFISVYQKEGINHFSVKRLKYAPINPFANPLRQNNSFNNFILISTIILIAFFAALLRTNPQLTLDYLNVVKLFSLRDRDENQITLRITSSVNFLFYSFAGLLSSLALLIATHFSAKGFSVIANLGRSSTGQYFLQWISLALVVVVLLMVKLGLAKIISLLFGWRDTAGFQFFHFVRVLVLMLFLIGAISIFCFSMGINTDYYLFIKMGCLIMSVGALLLYFKLLAKAQFSSFHLFSYLCATEFIPLVILIKVFLY